MICKRVTLKEDHLPLLLKVVKYNNGQLINIETKVTYGSLDKAGYLDCSIKVNESIKIRGYVHRIIFLIFNEYLPHHVDHKDRDRVNNLIDNLRAATSSQNGHNCNISINNKSGVNGVYYDRGRSKWSACIKINHKKIGFKRFNTIEEAITHRLYLEDTYIKLED